ncbi:MAG: anthranilate synthase component I [Acidobacteriota bacterium]
MTAPMPPLAGEPRRTVVHVRELLADSLTPLAVYRRLRAISPVRFLFESVTGGEQVSRFSFLGAGPREVYRLWPDRVERTRDGKTTCLNGEPLEALRTVLAGFAGDQGPIPFTGGFVGFFGYDIVRLVEHLPSPPAHDPYDLPIALFGRFDEVVVFDHAQQRVLAIANEIEGEVSVLEAEQALARLVDLLTAEGGAGGVALPPRSEVQEMAPIGEASIDGPSYRAAVERAKEFIRAGDIFQVVLARRFTVPDAPRPVALYRALRVINPSPYMVLLETDDAALVGCSPEMLVRKSGRRLENRPIAGTRPRGADAVDDERLAQDLLADPKERAEHVMLVDLGRNDVGKVGRPGTVDVETFMQIERYSHVMHIVSSVAAELDEGHDALDALLSCFPAGTVSGAPKIRAMEIIDELEPERRGPYAGAVGYVSFTGDVDTCITLRTLVVRDGKTSISAGAGLVADSDPAAEERETENKAAALLAAVALAQRLDAADAERRKRTEPKETPT